mmetsp:Transcript_11571/g.23730  ORF Transcript_11571/g.23730 Transcript_11571/m.23730 type:complete len:437 (-) Transcript_11571:263-1573(-)|eukprot:CAMPEP_0172440046 /NCGR_PEP_ID=MMETSP1065-20121228/835_1 /TAXON_ID=265537 /ORGANISM="Amphiprora paludosa, Strain CCMP125" /LENGTH=436 /DNA_ID=CAMNT_0013188827 /DNA_START=115 /DNA_END=1425 /DNA_ORIENTATION=-
MKGITTTYRAFLVLMSTLAVSPSNVFAKTVEQSSSSKSADSAVATETAWQDTSNPNNNDSNPNESDQQQPQASNKMLLAPKGKDCLINCENGGICEFVAEELRDLRYIAQSGGLIQRCRCPPGWGGVSCEIPTENCVLSTKTCEISKRPCDKVGNQWTCHCHIAANVDSNFAAAVCKRGYTEYCSDYYDPEGPLYFCANGGKCMSDFLSAKESPGDLSARRKYMDAGCMCNENFHGERCEKLKFGKEDLQGFVDPVFLAQHYVDDVQGVQGKNKNAQQDDSSFDLTHPMVLAAMGVVFVFLVAGVVAIVYLTRRRSKRREKRRHESSIRKSRRHREEADQASAHSSETGSSYRANPHNTNDPLAPTHEEPLEEVYINDHLEDYNVHFQQENSHGNYNPHHATPGAYPTQQQPASAVGPSGPQGIQPRATVESGVFG